MFYIALLVFILLGGTALVIIYQNFSTLLSGEHLVFLTWRLPGVPILLLCLLGALLGGLLLYVFSAFAARRDAREIKNLRTRIAELEKAQAKSPSGALMTSIVPPVVPIPGISTTGPLSSWQFPPNSRPTISPTGPLSQKQLSSTLPNVLPASSFPPTSLLAKQPPSLPQQGDLRFP